MDLLRHFNVLKRHRWLILALMIVMGLEAAVMASLRTPVYRATATVLLRPNDPAERLNPQNSPRPFVDDPDRYVNAQKDIVASEAVAREAIKVLSPGTTVSEVQQRVSVSQKGASDILAISAMHVSPRRARDIANAVAHGYLENRRQTAVAGLLRATRDIEARLEELQRRIAELDTKIASTGPGQAPTTAEALRAEREAAVRQYDALFSRQQELLVDINLKRGEAELISSATVPTVPVNPEPVRTGLLGAFLGLVLGAGVSLLRDQFDDRVSSNAEIERATGLPVLAEVPRDQQAAKKGALMASPRAPATAFAEGIRMLRTSIDIRHPDQSARVIVVTSPGHGEGKSLVSAQLAAAYAQSGRRACLVCADLRRPPAGVNWADGHSSPGLTGVLMGVGSGRREHEQREDRGGQSLTAVAMTGDHGRMALPSAARHALVATTVPNLFLLPAGPLPPNPAELLGSPRMSEVLADLCELADVVLLDTPPLLAVTDATVLAPRADGVVLVTAIGETRARAAVRAVDMLEATGVNLLGTVINKTTISRESYYFAYLNSRRSWRRGGRRKGVGDVNSVGWRRDLPGRTGRSNMRPGAADGRSSPDRSTSALLKGPSPHRNRP